jgi:hypothetical protein
VRQILGALVEGQRTRCQIASLARVAHRRPNPRRTVEVLALFRWEIQFVVDRFGLRVKAEGTSRVACVPIDVGHQREVGGFRLLKTRTACAANGAIQTGECHSGIAQGPGREGELASIVVFGEEVVSHARGSGRVEPGQRETGLSHLIRHHGEVDQRAQLQCPQAQLPAGREAGGKGFARVRQVSDPGVPETEVHRGLVHVLLVSHLAGNPHGPPP